MDDNTYECPNCGAVIYNEMTRCPACGQNMYPEVDEQAEAEAEQPAPVWLAIIGSLFIGWMIAAGIALLVHFIIDAFVNPALLGSWGKVILYLAGPLGVLVGAYVCTGISRQRRKLIGGVVGLLTVPILVLFATHWVEVTLNLLYGPWGIVLGVLTVLAGVLGGWLNETFSPENNWREKWRVHGWEDLLYQDLLRRVRFNGSAADRLIEYERKLNPQASRLKLIQSAIERWEHDNR